MKLINFIIEILCGFVIVLDVNAMRFNKPDISLNFQYTNMSSSKIIRELRKDIQCFKKNVIAEMTDFDQTIQSLELEVLTKTKKLCQHFWQLELLVKEQVTEQINVDREERDLRTYWKRYFRIMGDEQMSRQFDVSPLFRFCYNIEQAKRLFYEEIVNPLSCLSSNIKESRHLFHDRMNELTENVYQLNKIVTLLKGKSIQRKDRVYGDKLCDEVRQLCDVVDEYFSGSCNHIEKLESVVEEQITESEQDVKFLKVKIDKSFSKLWQSWIFRSNLLQFYEYQWIFLSRYVRDIGDVTCIENNLEMRMEVSEFKKIIYKDLSLLYQNVISLQSSVDDEFSYKYNKFLRYKPQKISEISCLDNDLMSYRLSERDRLHAPSKNKPREGSKLKISTCFRDIDREK